MNTAPATHAPDAAVRLRQLQSLAPLPVVARRLLQDLERDDLSLGQLASVIEMDPGLTARIVGLANSAYFASGRPVSNVTDAVGRVLGLDLVKNLALGIVLSGPFDTRRCAGFDTEAFWFRAMGSATLAVPLAQALDSPLEHDWVYLGGLLHELGLLALCALCPDAMSRVLSAARNEAVREDTVSMCVHAELGLTPAEAGAVLARRWRLPSPVAAVMTQCGDHEYRGEYWRTNAVVGLASAVAKDLYEEREDSDLRNRWLVALGLPARTVSDLVERHRPRVESLRALSRHMASS